jgi:DNA-binding FrmR family transcriptional regulator
LSTHLSAFILDDSSTSRQSNSDIIDLKRSYTPKGICIGLGGILASMSHTIRKKRRLTHRVARIRGQVDALARALVGEAECGQVLGLIASARGAMDSLMAEVIEDHIRDHVFRGARGRSDEREAAADLVKIVRSYLK